MKYLISLILILVVGAQASPATVCESEASPGDGIVSALRMLQLALNLGEITAEQLLDFSKSSVWVDPLALQKRNEETLSLRQAFARSTASLSIQERRQIQFVARAMADKATREQSHADNIREKTAKIFGLRTIKQILDSHYKLVFDVIQVRYHEGRPLVMAKVAYTVTSQQWKTLVFDPFNPEEQRRLYEISEADPTWNRDDIRHVLFATKGVLHAAVETEGLIYSLESRQHSQVPAHDSKQPMSYRIIDSDSGPLAIFASPQNHLRIYDLERPTADPKLIHVKSAYGQVTEEMVGSKPYVLVESTDHLEVLDVNAGKIIHEIDFKTWPTIRHNHKVLFEELDQLHLLYLVRHDDKHEMRVLNLATGDDRTLPQAYRPSSSGPMKIFDLKGAPHLYYTDHDKLVVQNLRTGNLVERQAKDDGIFAGGQFRVSWDGRQLLVLMDHLGLVHIYDFEIQDFVAHVEHHGKLIPFVYDGNIYALVSHAEGGFTLDLMSILDHE